MSQNPPKLGKVAMKHGMMKDGREVRIEFPVLDAVECNRRLAAAKARRAERRALWSITLNALAKDPALRDEFAAGIRGDLK